MLAVQKLVAGTKVDKALAGALLPENNNRAFLQIGDMHTATVVQTVEGTPLPIGFGMAQRCSPNQLYCSLISMSKQFESGYVSVQCVKSIGGDGDSDEKRRRHTLLQIKDMRQELPDLSGLPQYFSAFAEPLGRPLLQCIVDQLVTDTFGSTFNVELSRNLTVDLYDAEAGIQEHPDSLWRDFAGFMVADRYRYCEIDIKCGSLLAALSGASAQQFLPSNVSIQPLNKATRSLFHAYDQAVTVMDRSEHLDFLMGLAEVSGVVAMDEQHQPVGYALAIPGRVLQCCAESEQLASALLNTLLSSSDSNSTVSLYFRMGADHAMDANILPKADQIRRIRRFHTRNVPGTVKWAKVFVPNIGVHLF